MNFREGVRFACAFPSFLKSEYKQEDRLWNSNVLTMWASP